MKKIRNVELSTCCGEQMAAYHAAFECNINEYTGERAKEWLYSRLADYPNLPKTFDFELCVKCFCDSFPNYTGKIAFDYEDVSAMFPII